MGPLLGFLAVFAFDLVENRDEGWYVFIGLLLSLRTKIDMEVYVNRGADPPFVFFRCGGLERAHLYCRFLSRVRCVLTSCL